MGLIYDSRLFGFIDFSFDGIRLEFFFVEILKYLKPPLTIFEIRQTITQRSYAQFPVRRNLFTETSPINCT